MFEGAMLVLLVGSQEGVWAEEGIRVWSIVNGKFKLVAHMAPYRHEQLLEWLAGVAEQGMERSVMFEVDDGVSGLWVKKEVK